MHTKTSAVENTYPQDFPVIDREFDRFEFESDFLDILHDAESGTLYEEGINRK